MPSRADGGGLPDIVLTEDELKTLLDRRDVIAAAKGMVMERFQIDADEAWDLMRRLSMDTNTAVYDIARRLLRGLDVNPRRPRVLG